MAGWTANGTRQKMDNTFLKDFIGFGTDDVFVIPSFQKFIKVRRGKSGVPSEIAAQVPFPVTLDDGFQNVAPAVGAMNIAGAQRTPLKVTELVEQEQRMVAGAAIGCAMGTIPLTPQHIELYIKIFTSGHRKPSSLGK